MAERTTWDSKCREYRVIKSHIPYAYGQYRGSEHLGYEDIFYAMHYSGAWDIISKHRKRLSAMKACYEHEKHNRRTNKGVGSGTSRGGRGKAVQQRRAGGRAKRKGV